MKRAVLVLVLVLTLVTIMALIAVPGHAGAQDRLSVTGQSRATTVPLAKSKAGTAIQILNSTGHSFYHVYVSPSDSPDWGLDLLGPADMIANGAVYDTYIRPGSGTYDIWCIDSEGYSYYKWGISFERSNTAVVTSLDLDLGGVAIEDTNWTDTIKIANNTGFSIYYIYMTPSEYSQWGEDLLGLGTISHGEVFDTGITTDTALYDIKLVDKDGDSYTKWEVDLSQSSTVEFTIWDIDLDWPTESQTSYTLTIFNATGYAMKEVYISSSNSEFWGQNQLAVSKTIPNKGSYDVTVSGDEEEYDLKLVDTDGDSYFRWNVDLSQNEWIVLTLGDLSL